MLAVHELDIQVKIPAYKVTVDIVYYYILLKDNIIEHTSKL